jgi:hypothetical protein
MMTKQHFESIAAVLKSLKPRVAQFQDNADAKLSLVQWEMYGAAQRQWKATVRAFAADSHRQNARFQEPRFYAACDADMMEAD